MKAIAMALPGGIEVLQPFDRPEPVPGPGEALVEVAGRSRSGGLIGSLASAVERSDPELVRHAGTALDVWREALALLGEIARAVVAFRRGIVR